MVAGAVGIRREVVVPSPNLLLVLLPQHFKLDEDSVIQVCVSAAEMEIIGFVEQLRHVLAVVTKSG